MHPSGLLFRGFQARPLLRSYVMSAAASSAATPSAAVTLPIAHFNVLATAGSARNAAISGVWPSVVTGPVLTLPTQYGQVANLLRDTLLTVDAEVAPVAAVRQVQFWEHEDVVARTGKSLAEYCSLPGKGTFLTLRLPSDKERYDATDATVSMQTAPGMRQVTVAAFCKQAVLLGADAVASMVDDVTPSAGKNRRRNAADRTVAWLRECSSGLAAASAAAATAAATAGRPAAPRAPPKLFASVPAIPDPVLRKRFVEGLMGAITAATAGAAAGTGVPIAGLFFTPSFWEEPANGVSTSSSATSGKAAVASAGAGTSSASDAAAKRAPGLDLPLLKATIAELPADLPRILSAPLDPLEALEAIAECGIDAIDSDYVPALALAGKALSFDLEPQASSTAAAAGAEASAGAGSAAASTSSSGAGASPVLLDMRDGDTYRRDGGPLVKGCPCFACAGVSSARVAALPASGLAAGGAPMPHALRAPVLTSAASHAGVAPASVAGAPGSAAAYSPPSHPGHTRAYIHHLVNCDEILGKALLSAHNAVHAGRFMAAVRAHVAAGTLPAYREGFRSQYATAAAAGAAAGASEGADGSAATSAFPSLAALQAEAEAAAGGEGADEADAGEAGAAKAPAAKRPARGGAGGAAAAAAAADASSGGAPGGRKQRGGPTAASVAAAAAAASASAAASSATTGQ